MKHFSLLICFLFSINLSYSQESLQDSNMIYPQREVIVTATRSTISPSDAPSPVDILDCQTISNMNGSTVADVLKYSGSIFLNDNGGNALLKTASIRGSSSQHLLVLVNGNRFNSLQNGLAYLNLLPLNDVQQIEIVHGGNSALYGADALGGVMNIITRQASKTIQSRTEATAGSFGYQKYLIEGGGRTNLFGMIAGYAYEKSKDDYEYHFRRDSNTDTIMRRQNSDISSRQLYTHANLITDEQSSVNLSVKYLKANFGVPGSTSFMSSSARQSDEDVNISVNYLDKHFEDIQISVLSGMHYEMMKYSDTNPYYPINSHYRNIFLNLNPQVTIKMSNTQRFIIGGELSNGRLWSNDFDNKIRRAQSSLYLSSESNYSFNRTIFNKISYYQTIRYDRFSDVGFAVTPKAGLNVRITETGDLRFRSSFGQDYRMPSFNDLYYRGFSNPGLKQERSTSFDAGFLSKASLYGNHRAELTYFHLNTTDRIILNQTTYIPENIGKAISNGIELRYDGQFLDDMLAFGINYSFTDAKKKNRDYATDSTYNKQLISVPKEVFNLLVSVSYSALTFNLNFSSIGKRFTRMDNEASLPSYNLVNANIVLRPVFGRMTFLLKGEANNIFNKDYQVIKDYPIPGRNYRITIGIEYGKS